MHILKTLCFAYFASAGIGCAQLFADFQTSMGDFTCELNYGEAPQAVANFIGLAEGTRPWIDPATGSVRRGVSFYNGTRFHRVIDGFMNQAGSRNGLGTDGPGYKFRDEFTPGRTHSTAGVLSMANSGKNTNGAQFFITVAAQPSLDGSYTIFGKVTSGMSVVTAINGVPKSLNGNAELAVPVTPVLIHAIAIRRSGAAAQAFDIDAQNLPLCGGVVGSLKVTPGVIVDYVLASPQPAGTQLLAFRSPNLLTWTKLGEIYQGTGSTGDPKVTFEDSAIAARAFYNVPLVQYPGALGPAATGGRTLTVTFGTEYLLYQINAAGDGGTYQYFDGESLISGTLTSLDFESTPWSATWIMGNSAPLPSYLRVTAALDSATATLIQGRMSLDHWNGFYWQNDTSGTISLTK